MDNQNQMGAWGRRVLGGIFFVFACTGGAAQEAENPEPAGTESAEIQLQIDESRVDEGRYRLDFSIPADVELGPDAF